MLKNNFNQVRLRGRSLLVLLKTTHRPKILTTWPGWTGKLALAGLASVLIYLVIYLLVPFGSLGVPFLSDFGEVPLEAVCVVLGLMVAHRERRGHARLAWRFFVLAMAGNLLGNVIYGLYDQAGQQPFPSIADVFYLSFYPLTFIGLFCLPAASARREILGWRVWTNVAVVILGGALVLIHFVLMPVLAQITGDPLATVISLAYPAGDLALLAALATIINRRPFIRDRLALSCFIVAVAAWFLADLIFAILSADGLYTAGSPSDFIWLVGDLAFLLAAESRLVNLTEQFEETGSSAPLSIGRFGPYAMLALGLITLILAAIQLDVEMTALVILSVGLTALVALRQLLDERERRSVEAELLVERSAAADEATRQARHDPLTDLPNRVSLHEILGVEIAVAQITERPLALAFLSLNLFKAVNDNFGHEMGDRLLIEVGRRLSQSVRSGDTVARLGGDAFALVLPGAKAAEAAEVAERVQREIERPFMLGGVELDIGVAIGLATYSAGGNGDDDVLMHQADTAMYRAKRMHLGPMSYDPTFEGENPGISDLAELRRAVAGDGLVLLFQPISERLTHRIIGAEALVRWQHPSRGLLGAGEIIPLATQTGLMRALDRRVLDLACAQTKAWLTAGVTLRTSINVSRDSLQDPDFADYVQTTLNKYGLAGRNIELEITEEGLLDNFAQAGHFVSRMRELDIRMSIDDFGTGYSSLARLRNLPVQTLKIDQSFVKGALIESADAAIVESVIALGHHLGMALIAEGVEDQATLSYLEASGVDLIQGYFLGRPMSAVDLSTLLEAGQRSETGKGRARAA
jgi:diguanylate cyclase (GGDEF)-like protein